MNHSMLFRCRLCVTTPTSLLLRRRHYQQQQQQPLVKFLRHPSLHPHHFYSSVRSPNYHLLVHNYPSHSVNIQPFGQEIRWWSPHRKTTTRTRSKWSISLNDTITDTTPAVSTAESSTNSYVKHKPSNEKHTVLDVSTYHGWDSIDAQDTTTDDTGVIVKKEVAEWDPVRKMVVKRVVTTLVTPKASHTSRSRTTQGMNDDEKRALMLADFAYDGKNTRLKAAKATKKAKVKAAQNDPISKYCKKCPICMKHFAGHNSMVSHLLYRDKCYNELDNELKIILINQKHKEQQKRLRHKMRKKHLPTYSDDETDQETKVRMVVTEIDPNRDLRFKLQRNEPETERAINYKEKMRLINEKFGTLTTTTTDPNPSTSPSPSKSSTETISKTTATTT